MCESHGHSYTRSRAGARDRGGIDNRGFHTPGSEIDGRDAAREEQDR